MMNRTVVLGLICVALLTLAAPPALAGSHLWRIHEVFSSADGSVQFISEFIDAHVLAALTTRSGGEAISATDL